MILSDFSHPLRVLCLGCRSKYSNVQNRSIAHAIGLCNSYKLGVRFKIGVGICAVLAGDTVVISEVDKLVQVG